jgi:hypothetical protein
VPYNKCLVQILVLGGYLIDLWVFPLITPSTYVYDHLVFFFFKTRPPPHNRNFYKFKYLEPYPTQGEKDAEGINQKFGFIPFFRVRNFSFRVFWFSCLIHYLCLLSTFALIKIWIHSLLIPFIRVRNFCLKVFWFSCLIHYLCLLSTFALIKNLDSYPFNTLY